MSGILTRKVSYCMRNNDRLQGPLKLLLDPATSAVVIRHVSLANIEEMTRIKCPSPL